MQELYDEVCCDTCPARRWCRGMDSCDRMLERFVEEERDDWYEAWFAYIGEYSDGSCLFF